MNIDPMMSKELQESIEPILISNTFYKNTNFINSNNLNSLIQRHMFYTIQRVYDLDEKGFIDLIQRFCFKPLCKFNTFEKETDLNKRLENIVNKL